MPVEIRNPYSDDSSLFSAEVEEGDYPTHSRLLDKDGNPMAYHPRQRLGFDLTKRQQPVTRS